MGYRVHSGMVFGYAKTSLYGTSCLNVVNTEVVWYFAAQKHLFMVPRVCNPQILKSSLFLPTVKCCSACILCSCIHIVTSTLTVIQLVLQSNSISAILYSLPIYNPQISGWSRFF